MTALTLRPEAAADVEDAYLWYEAQRPGLGEEFLESLDSTLRLIEENPKQYQIVHRDIRRVLLRRFPYCVYYLALEQGVVVLACLYARRDPRTWKTRR